MAEIPEAAVEAGLKTLQALTWPTPEKIVCAVLDAGAPFISCQIAEEIKDGIWPLKSDLPQN